MFLRVLNNRTFHTKLNFSSYDDQRYLQALAPGVDPFTDPRVSLFGDSSSGDTSNSRLDVDPLSNSPKSEAPPVDGGVAAAAATEP